MSARRMGIECAGLSKSYPTPSGTVRVLDRLDLSLAAGSFVALIGRSGSGKSTLLRLLAALDAPDAGEIEVDGVSLTSLRGRALTGYRRHVVTYCAQRPAANLVPHLRLREQVTTEAGLELVARAGLGHRLSARAAQLSGGEQGRAALVVALERDTNVLVVDEPTAELDRATADWVRVVLRERASSGRTVVVATHDRDLIATVDRVADLSAVRGSSSTLARRPRGAAVQPPVLAVTSLAKRWSGGLGVADVDLSLERGEIGVLVGRSGSGKSTVLMCIAGWLRPDAGTIALGPGGGDRSWSSVAYVPQRFGLLPELSVLENVELPLRLSAARAERDRARALLDALELTHLAARAPSEISIGQQQRAALARALVGRPALLVADEPTSHQDAESADAVWRALAAASEDGTASLVATHDEAAAANGDRVWRISDGRVAVD